MWSSTFSLLFFTSRRMPANMAKKKNKKNPVPVPALRQVRDATGLSQPEFAQLVGVSAPYIQAIELGQRGPNRDFVQSVADKTGAWSKSILENWGTAVDIRGQPYTKESYRWFTSGEKEGAAGRENISTVNDSEMKKLLDSVIRIVRAAEEVGKAAVAMNMLREELLQFGWRALNVPAIENGLRIQFATVGRLTFGMLRSDKELAAKVGFIDDPTHKDNEPLPIHNSTTETKEQIFEKLFPKQVVPGVNWDEIKKKYAKAMKYT